MFRTKIPDVSLILNFNEPDNIGFVGIVSIDSEILRLPNLYEIHKNERSGQVLDKLKLMK